MEAAVKQHLSHLFFWLANKMSLTSVAAQKHLPLLLNTSKYKEAGGESLISTPGKAGWFKWSSKLVHLGSFSEIRQQSLHPFLKKE